LGLALSPDGTTLASACKDGVVAFWSADPRQEQEEEMPKVIPMGGSARVAFAPDSWVLAVPQANTVSLFGLATSKEIEPLPKTDAAVSAIAYSPDGTLLVSGEDDGRISVWSCAERRLLRELDDHKEQIVLLRFRADGARMLSLDATGNVIWWDALTWQAGQPFAVELPDAWQEPWRPVDVSADGRLLAFGTRQGAVRWLNAETGELVATTGGAQPVAQIAFSPDGSRLASTSVHGTVALWDPSSFSSVTSFRAHLLGASGVAFSPDGRRLATCGGTSRDAVRLWDLSTLRELMTLSGQTAVSSFVAFSSDGRWLAACSRSEGKLHLWRAPSWEEIEAEEEKLQSGQSP
jgi:WD40 repeat protein